MKDTTNAEYVRYRMEQTSGVLSQDLYPDPGSEYQAYNDHRAYSGEQDLS